MSSTEITIIVVLVGGVLAFVALQAAGNTSSSATQIQFSQPDPSSVASLADATAQESQAQTNYLAGIAQNGANIATTLINDQTALRAQSLTNASALQQAQIAAGTTSGANAVAAAVNEYDTYIAAGSTQNVQTIATQGQEALAQIQAGEAEQIASLQASAAVDATNAGASTAAAGDETAQSIADTQAQYGFFGSALSSITNAIASIYGGGKSTSTPSAPATSTTASPYLVA